MPSKGKQCQLVTEQPVAGTSGSAGALVQTDATQVLLQAVHLTHDAAGQSERVLVRFVDVSQLIL